MMFSNMIFIMFGLFLGDVKGSVLCPSYHILPNLNYLIFASYCKAKESPKHVIKRWKDDSQQSIVV